MGNNNLKYMWRKKIKAISELDRRLLQSGKKLFSCNIEKKTKHFNLVFGLFIISTIILTTGAMVLIR